MPPGFLGQKNDIWSWVLILDMYYLLFVNSVTSQKVAVCLLFDKGQGHLKTIHKITMSNPAINHPDH